MPMRERQSINEKCILCSDITRILFNIIYSITVCYVFDIV